MAAGIAIDSRTLYACVNLNCRVVTFVNADGKFSSCPSCEHDAAKVRGPIDHPPPFRTLA